ncbi:MAG: hypothetical protein U0893_12985 [Chloroflexota bacterium]
MTPRDLIEGDPAGWLRWVGLPVDGPVRTIDSEVSTVLAEVDKVIAVDAARPWVAHLELQSTYDPELPVRLLVYHALLLQRRHRRVRTTVVLLRESADGPGTSGLFEELDDDPDPTLAFRYRVVRVWQRPVEELLTGSLRVLPLAPLAAIAPAELPAVLHRIDDRLAQEVESGLADLLRAATFLMLELRYDRNQYREILQSMIRWRESGAYQMILEEGIERGRADGERRLLVMLGEERLGPLDEATRARLDAVEDVSVLERLARRMLTVASWQELLATE